MKFAFISTYRIEIVASLINFLLIFVFLGISLWVNYPYGCGPGPDECYKTNLNQARLELFLTLAPIASAIVVPATAFFIYNYRSKSRYFSDLGLISLSWPAITYLMMIIMFWGGAFFAPVGVGLSLLALIFDLVGRIRAKKNPMPRGDFFSVVVNMVWCIFAYDYLLRIWDVFGD